MQMNLVVAAKLKNGEWRSATIADGRFVDVVVSPSLTDVVGQGVAGALAASYPEGTEINVTLTVQHPASQTPGA
jgi:hypothetical protein